MAEIHEGTNKEGEDVFLLGFFVFRIWASNSPLSLKEKELRVFFFFFTFEIVSCISYITFGIIIPETISGMQKAIEIDVL